MQLTFSSAHRETPHLCTIKGREQGSNKHNGYNWSRVIKRVRGNVRRYSHSFLSTTSWNPGQSVSRHTIYSTWSTWPFGSSSSKAMQLNCHEELETANITKNVESVPMHAHTQQKQSSWYEFRSRVANQNITCLQSVSRDVTFDPWAKNHRGNKTFL